MVESSRILVTIEEGFLLAPNDGIVPAWRLTDQRGEWLIVDEYLGTWGRGSKEQIGAIAFYATREDAIRAALAGQREKAARSQARIAELQAALLTEMDGAQ